MRVRGTSHLCCSAPSQRSLGFVAWGTSGPPPLLLLEHLFFSPHPPPPQYLAPVFLGEVPPNVHLPHPQQPADCSHLCELGQEF